MRISPIATLSAVLALLFILTPYQSLAKESGAEAWKGELPVRDAYLRHHMPPDAGAYLRIPDWLGFFSMPKGDVLDSALRSKANVDNAQKIRDGLIKNVLGEFPAFSSPEMLDFVGKFRSPIEVAVLTEPAPAAVFAVNLGFASQDEFQDAMTALGKVDPVFRLARPLDARGFGLTSGPVPQIFLHFDGTTGQLLFGVGPGVTFESFVQTVQQIKDGNTPPMRAMENRIDDNGQGLFLWVNARQIMPVMEMFLPPEQLAAFKKLGLDKVDSAALGWGVSRGKGRLALVANLPSGQDRGFLPNVSNSLGARSVGDPDGLVVIWIPSPEEFTRLESLALAIATPESAAKWREAKEAIHESTGIRVEELFQAIGPDFAMIFDRAGEYTALKLRDADLFDSIITRLAESTGAVFEQRKIRRKTYFHFSAAQGMETDDEIDVPAWLNVHLSRNRSHLYWTRDGDYLYLYSTPQVLIDRESLGARKEVGDWLKETQKIEASNVLLSISGTSEKLPRRIYGVYLEILQYLADIGKAEMDMWAMPTPAELGLPRNGTLGFTVTLGDPMIGAELTYEASPVEMLGGAGGIATAGILAAIAIPAYQDYTKRAQVGEGFVLGANARITVETHYAAAGRFPDVQEAAELSVMNDAGKYARSITVEPFTGVVMIDYYEEFFPAGSQVTLRPIVEPDGSLNWECTASLAQKFLPRSCKATVEAEK